MNEVENGYGVIARPECFVGRTILSQIQQQDRMALAAWGARQYVVWEDPMQVTGQGMDKQPVAIELGQRGGGVMFKVRGTHPGYGRGAKIMIGLQWDDTYTVVGLSIRGVVVTIRDVVEGVYFDQLVQVIDGLVG